jgi:peptide/nickel transport system permease protein
MATKPEQTAQETGAAFSLDTPAVLAEEHTGEITGRSPWFLAWRRLRRNYVALIFFGIFVVIVAACFMAPLYANHVAHTGPNDNHITDNVNVGGHLKPVISQGGTFFDKKTNQLRVKPVTILSPTWWQADGKFVLGADGNGRDVAVRLLYGGRNSLKVGIGSALICTFFAIILALLAGYYRGATDWIITRFFDLIWAFPVLLLAIALGAALSINGINWGPIHVPSGSLLIPTLVISIVLIPYIGRPLRGQILSLREKEFVEAARSLGASDARIIIREVLPNLVAPITIWATLLIPSNILFEAALSFLGVGVPIDTPSWGQALSNAANSGLYKDAPWLMIFPGVFLVLTTLAFNLLGDGLRDALDPRSGR